MKIHLKLFLFLFYFLSACQLSAQKASAIDSLQNVLKTAKEDTSKVFLLNELSNQYKVLNDYENAIQYANAALALADKLNFKKGQATIYLTLGRINARQNKFIEALQYDSISLQICKQIGYKYGEKMCYDWVGQLYWYTGNYSGALEKFFASIKIAKEAGDKNLSIAYNGIGNCLSRMGNYPEALKYYFAYLNNSKELNDKWNIATAYGNIGNVYEAQGNYPEALQNYFACSKAMELVGEKGGVAESNNNIGNIYRIQNNYAEAIEYYFKAIKNAQEINERYKMAESHNGIGLAYSKQGNSTEAMKHFYAALKLAKEVNVDYTIAIALSNIGQEYLFQKKYAEAKKNFQTALDLNKKNKLNSNIADNYIALGKLSELTGDFGNSKKYLGDAISLSKEIGSKELISESYHSMAELGSAIGNFAQAFANYKMSVLYRDSMLNEKTNKQTSLLKIQYETEKKDREIAENKMQMALKETELTKKSNANRMLIAGIAVLVLLIVLGSISFIQRQKLRDRDKEIEKQIALEQTRAAIARDLHDDIGATLSSVQIMSSFASQSIEVNNRDAIQWIKKVGDSTGDILQNIRDIIWTMNPDNDRADELFIRMKQFASQVLEPKNIQYSFTVNDEVEPYLNTLPAKRNLFLVYKEALNNAAKYSNCSQVNISFKMDKLKCMLRIEDNGIGFDANTVVNGNGIKNMKRRALLLNGTIEIFSVLGKGTSITMIC